MAGEKNSKTTNSKRLRNIEDNRTEGHTDKKENKIFLI
jgi:hypothetical protein